MENSIRRSFVAFSIYVIHFPFAIQQQDKLIEVFSRINANVTNYYTRLSKINVNIGV